jgi:hypothetical protein
MFRRFSSVFLLVACLAGCGQPPAPSAARAGVARPAQPARPIASGAVRGAAWRALPEEFFPMVPGARWRYTVEVGSVEPLRYAQQRWPRGGASLVYATWGRFVEALDKPGKRFKLEYRVRAPAAQQGPLKYRRGVELQIIEDELGIFDRRFNVKQVFWAMDESDRVLEVRVLDGMRSPARGMYGIEPDGAELHLVFFPADPHTMISLNPGDEDPPADRLVFLGGSAQRQQLHFLREVQAIGERGVFGRGFTETRLYERGKGLVSLVQEVEGRMSMRWTLEEFVVEPPERQPPNATPPGVNPVLSRN